MESSPTAEPPLIDLVREHQTNSVKEDDMFPSMAAATHFFQDYNFNHDKAIKKNSHDGISAAYICADPRWNAKLYR